VRDASPRLRKLCTDGVPASHVSVHIKRLFRLGDPKEVGWGWLTGVICGTPLSVPGFDLWRVRNAGVDDARVRSA
jgi:hypothetical protein